MISRRPDLFFDANSGTHEAFLFGLLRNVSRRTCEEEGQCRPEVAYDDITDRKTPSVHEEMEKQESLKMVREWIQKLSPKQREALEEKYSNKIAGESAEQTPRRVIHIRRSHALRRLRARVEVAAVRGQESAYARKLRHRRQISLRSRPRNIH